MAKISIDECAELLKEYDNYLILTHRNPDGDTLGSAARLCHALTSIGKTCAVTCHNRIPDKYRYMDVIVR